MTTSENQADGVSAVASNELLASAPAWRKPIPPSMIEIKQSNLHGGVTCTKPQWNPEWLTGLEQFVRAIVRDELNKANRKLSGPGPDDNE